MTTELEVTIQVIEGQKIGLRINNANVVCGVHPGTAAAAAGLRVDDLVVAVDGTDCAGGVTAVSLWSKGASLQQRKLRIQRAGEKAPAFPPPPERSSPKAVVTEAAKPQPTPLPTVASVPTGAATASPAAPKRLASSSKKAVSR